MSSLICKVPLERLENTTKVYEIFKEITIKNLGTWTGSAYIGSALKFSAETEEDNSERVILELPLGDTVTIGRREMQTWEKLEINATGTVAQLIIYK